MSRELARLEEIEEAADERISDRARPIPRISIQAFCERAEMADVVQVAAEDRRLIKTHVSVHMGGVQAAVAHYQESPTPNLIIIESTLPQR
jgi:pilus assembly protein CpaE